LFSITNRREFHDIPPADHFQAFYQSYSIAPKKSHIPGNLKTTSPKTQLPSPEVNIYPKLFTVPFPLKSIMS
jgi:hypothetical protein